MFAAVAVATALSGVSSLSFAGPVQLTEHTSAATWRAVFEQDSAATNADVLFAFDEATLVSLLLGHATAEFDMPFEPAVHQWVREFAVTSQSIADCWSADDDRVQLDPFFSMERAGRNVLLSAMRVVQQEPARAFDVSSPSVLEHHVLRWDGAAWGESAELVDHADLSLSLDYSTVSLPHPFVMGAIGLVAMVAIRKRRLLRLA